MFHMSEHQKASESEPSYVVNRDMRHQNIVRFSEEIKGINQDNVVDKRNAQEAYSAFHEIITEKYNLCFPIKKCKKRYYNKKPWLTSALKNQLERKINYTYREIKVMILKKGWHFIKIIEINWIISCGQLKESTITTFSSSINLTWKNLGMSSKW